MKVKSGTTLAAIILAGTLLPALPANAFVPEVLTTWGVGHVFGEQGKQVVGKLQQSIDASMRTAGNEARQTLGVLRRDLDALLRQGERMYNKSLTQSATVFDAMTTKKLQELEQSAVRINRLLQSDVNLAGVETRRAIALFHADVVDVIDRVNATLDKLGETIPRLGDRLTNNAMMVIGLVFLGVGGLLLIVVTYLTPRGAGKSIVGLFVMLSYVGVFAAIVTSPGFRAEILKYAGQGAVNARVQAAAGIGAGLPDTPSWHAPAPAPAPSEAARAVSPPPQQPSPSYRLADVRISNVMLKPGSRRGNESAMTFRFDYEVEGPRRDLIVNFQPVLPRGMGCYLSETRFRIFPPKGRAQGAQWLSGPTCYGTIEGWRFWLESSGQPGTEVIYVPWRYDITPSVAR